MKALFILAALLIGQYNLFAHQFDWNEACDDAYQKIFQFRFNEAQQILNAEDEENLIADFLENYIYFFKVLVDEQKGDLNKYLDFKDGLIAKLNKADGDNPYKRYCIAETQMYSAIARFTFDEYWGGFWDLKKAFKQFEENDRKFPEFLVNKKGLGLLHMMVGTIPDKYKWGAKIVGFNGTVEQGAAEIFEFVDAAHYEHITKDEAKLLYAAYQLFISQDEAVAQEMVDELDPNKSVINRFIVANLSYRMGYNEKAIQLLENRPTGSEYYPIAAFDLLVGTYKLTRLDTDSDKYIKRFLRDTKSKNYKKEAYQKLAWHELIINDNELGYFNYMEKIKAVGSLSEEEDKIALLEAEKGIAPNKYLLRAKLLYNGGYYERTLEELSNIEDGSLTDKEEILEMDYRYGRTFQQLNDFESGIAYLNQVVDNQTSSEIYYFAPKACIEIAEMYAEKDNNTSAMSYYNKALAYSSDYLYKDAIRNQAKQGLKRLK